MLSLVHANKLISLPNMNLISTSAPGETQAQATAIALWTEVALVCQKQAQQLNTFLHMPRIVTHTHTRTNITATMDEWLKTPGTTVFGFDATNPRRPAKIKQHNCISCAKVCPPTILKVSPTIGTGSKGPLHGLTIGENHTKTTQVTYTKTILKPPYYTDLSTTSFK